MDGGVWGALGQENDNADEGCVFILDDGGCCGVVRREKSPYCPHHHALCHAPEQSKRGRRRLKETEALASAVGGRTGRLWRLPPDPLLRRLENVARGFARSKCSCFVRDEEP